jgi:hypothetical protein
LNANLGLLETSFFLLLAAPQNIGRQISAAKNEKSWATEVKFRRMIQVKLKSQRLTHHWLAKNDEEESHEFVDCGQRRNHAPAFRRPLCLYSAET